MEATITDLNQASWSEVDNNNNSAAPNGFLSGSMLPSQLEPTCRAGMGALKRWHNQISPTVTSAGTANAQTLTHTQAHTALVSGDVFAFLVGVALTNTGAATLNVDGLGAKAIQIGTSALFGGELQPGNVTVVAYDGTAFQLISRGQIGEFQDNTLAQGSAVALTTGAPANVLSLSLAPGDWDVRAAVYFAGGANTTVNYLLGSISKTSATLDQTRSRYATQFANGGAMFGSNGTSPQGFFAGHDRFLLTAASSVFLVAQAGFGTSTLSAFGTISARRIR